ncbi:hypothetical protein K3495_g10845 [Podosphaera aphanis]|nr:hypothetical protein K3495_g10845 [Podosphaera aphanis]
MEEANRTQFASIKADMKSLAATQTRQAEASKLRETAMNDKFASMETALDNNAAKMEALSHSQRLQALNYESRLEKSENLLQLVVDRLDSLTNLITSNVSVAPKSDLIEAHPRVDKGKQPEIPKAAQISSFVPSAIKKDLSIPETQRSLFERHRKPLQPTSPPPQSKPDQTDPSFKWSLHPLDQGTDRSLVRLSDGSLNLDYRPVRYASNLSEQEKMIKSIWPDAKAKSDLYNYTGTSDSNKLFIKQDLRLVKADHTIFGKLKEI